jgi:hypothetical protein
LIVATLVLAVPATIQLIQARTNVQVSAKSGTFPRLWSGEPYRAVLVVITNHSPHDVDVPVVGLQFCRLLPFPRWRTFTQINPTFVTGTLRPRQKDEQYFERDDMVVHARAEGWRRGWRLVRARVEVVTIRPRHSPIIIMGLN